MARQRIRPRPESTQPAHPAPTAPDAFDVQSPFPNAVLEACVLVALAVVPLFFNPRTGRVFEPDKLAWLITLALLAGWGLIVGLAEASFVRARRPQPLALAIGTAAIALVAGTVVSRVPLVSFWGTYHRGQGLLAYAAFIVMALATALAMHRPAALARLRRVLILASIPAALYALLQRFQIDSITWDVYGAAPTERAFGPLGNPIFLGAYLVMVVPVALVGLGEGWRSWRRGTPGGALVTAGHLLALVLAVLALLATASRGPALGMVVGLGLLALLWATVTGRRRAALALACLGALGLITLAALSWAERPVLGGLLSPGSRTATERLLVWQALVHLAQADPKRAILGYGPDTLAHVLPPFLTADLIRLTPVQVFDRAHNVVWEWWVSAGVLGALALLLVYGTAFWTGFRLLGLVPDRRTTRLLAATLIGGAALGLLLPIGRGQPALAAAGAPLGLLVGAAAFVVMCAVGGIPRREDARRRPSGRKERPRSSGLADAPAPLVAALLAALAAHLVEGLVGLPTAAGELLFWVYLGVLMALSLPEPEQPAQANPRADGLVDGLVLAGVLFSPLLLPSLAAATHGRAAFLWLLLPVTWLGAELLSQPTGAPADAAWRNLHRLAVLGTLLVAFAVLRTRTGGPALAFGAVLIATAIALAIMLVRDRPPGRASPSWRWMVYAALGLLAGVGVWRLALVPEIADAHIRSGLEDGVNGNLGGSQSHFERAVTLWPQQPAYATYLAAIYQELAMRAEEPPDARAQAFGWAENALLRSIAQAPDDQVIQRLGTLYRDQGDLAAAPGEQRQAWQQARQTYERALAQNPHGPQTLTAYAAVVERLDEPERARRAYGDAFDLNPSDHEAIAGLVRTGLALGDVGEAAAALDRGLALNQSDPAPLGDAIRRGESPGVLALRAKQSRVLFLARTGQRAAAEQLLAEVEAATPGDPVTPRLRAWLAQGANGGS